MNTQKKAVLAAFLFVLFIGSVLLGAYFSRGAIQKSTDYPAAVSPTTEKPATNLSLSSAAKSYSVGQPQTVSVLLSSVPTAASDIVITYDPAVLTVGTPQNGEVFDRVIRKSAGEGVIVYSGAVSPEKKDTLTTGVVFTFTITPQTSGTTTLLFDRTKTITAVNGTNTLGTTGELMVEIQ